jgi:hypothetical protein
VPGRGKTRSLGDGEQRLTHRHSQRQQRIRLHVAWRPHSLASGPASVHLADHSRADDRLLDLLVGAFALALSLRSRHRKLSLAKMRAWYESSDSDVTANRGANTAKVMAVSRTRRRPSWARVLGGDWH